jgi:hypothetical protein
MHLRIGGPGIEIIVAKGCVGSVRFFMGFLCQEGSRHRSKINSCHSAFRHARLQTDSPLTLQNWSFLCKVFLTGIDLGKYLVKSRHLFVNYCA